MTGFSLWRRVSMRDKEVSRISHDSIRYGISLICALPKSSPPDCFYLRCALTLTSRHGRLQIPHSSLFGMIKKGHPVGYPFLIWRRVRDLNPRYQNGTQHFQCCSFGRSDNSTRPNESRRIQLPDYYTQSREKNQALFANLLFQQQKAGAPPGRSCR